MKLYVGADHAGFALKQELVAHAKAKGHEVVDLGPPTADRVDYPDFAVKVSKAVVAEKGSRGLLVCGTGIGMSIAANKVPGVRAAVVWNVESAKLASEHNAANVLAIGARQFAAPYASEMLDAWLATAPGGGRHAERVTKIDALERR